jgi:hypothetical protein
MKTTFVSRYGMYEYTMMSFGLTNVLTYLTYLMGFYGVSRQVYGGVHRRYAQEVKKSMKSSFIWFCRTSRS